jgi:hypothetical protein
MTSKRIVTMTLLLLVAASIIVFAGRQAGWISADSNAGWFEASKKEHRIIAYYFHATVRCHTCLTIEEYTDETLRSLFSDALKEGLLEWRVINTDEPDHKHFIDDYKLYSQALIVVDSADGKPATWTNLEEIWTYVGDRPAFVEYVRGEVANYLRRL